MEDNGVDIPRTQPEEHDRVELVDVGDEQSRQHDEQDDVAKNEVGREEAHLSDLTEELTAGLGQSVPSEGVPLASPPSDVGSIGTELSGKSNGNDELVDETLDGHGGDHAGKSPGEVPSLEEVHDLEEDDEGNDGDGVSNRGKDSTKLLAAHAEDRTHTASHAEEANSNTSVDGNGTESNNNQTDDGVRGGQVSAVVVGLDDTSSGVHEQVGKDGDGDEHKRADDLGEENVSELRARSVTRELGRGLAESLALETSEASTRQTNETDPRRGVSLGVATGQPSEELAVVDEEVGPGELVRVEHERRDAEREQGDPEPKQPVAPNGDGSEKQHEQATGAPVDRRTGETRVEDTERHASSGETTAGTDVTGTTVRQVLLDGVGVDLTDEHLEERRQRGEVLGQTGRSAPESTLGQLLNRERNEGDEEHNEDGDNATLNPVHDGNDVRAASRHHRVGDRDVAVVHADDGLVAEGTEVEQAPHEALHRQHDEQVVDVEARVSVEEGQEAIQRKLSAEVVVLARQHLFTHTSTDLGGEVENGAEAQVTTLTTLVVLAVLDSATTEDSSHTSVNILVQVQTLLSLGDTTTSGHEDTVQEIGVTIVELTADLSQSTSKESTECLFLSGSNVTKDTDVLRENVLASTENGNRVEVGGRKARSVRRNVVGGHLFELSKDGANLEALLKVVVLVSVDELDVFTTVEDQAVVLVVRLAVTENRVARKHDTELGAAHAVLHELGVTVDESRENPRVLALGGRRLLVKVGDLEVRVGAEKELSVLTLLLGELGVTLHRNADLELAASHALELTLKLV